MSAGDLSQQFVRLAAQGTGDTGLVHIVLANSCQRNTVYGNTVQAIRSRPSDFHGKVHFHGFAGIGRKVLAESTAVQLPVGHNEENTAFCGICRNSIFNLINMVTIIDLQVFLEQLRD